MIPDKDKMGQRQQAERLAVSGSVVPARSSIIERRLRTERRILIAICLLLPVAALLVWWWAR